MITCMSRNLFSFMFYHLGGFRILVDPKQRVVCCLNLGVGTATWGLEEVWERDAKPAAWQKNTAPSLLHDKRWKHILLGGIDFRWLEQPDGWSPGIPKAEKKQDRVVWWPLMYSKKGGWFPSLFKHQHLILSFAKHTKGWFEGGTPAPLS